MRGKHRSYPDLPKSVQGLLRTDASALHPGESAAKGPGQCRLLGVEFCCTASSLAMVGFRQIRKLEIG